MERYERIRIIRISIAETVQAKRRNLPKHLDPSVCPPVSSSESHLLTMTRFSRSLLTIVGIAWVFLLPLDDLGRSTYMDENAVSPAQVS